MSVMPSGPREQVDAAIGRILVAVQASRSAAEALIGDRKDFIRQRRELLRIRTDLMVMVRELREMRAELTPVHPSAELDMRASFQASLDHADPKRGTR